MSEFFAIALASLPMLAFVALIVETFRASRSDADLPPVDLFHRAYGA